MHRAYVEENFNDSGLCLNARRKPLQNGHLQVNVLQSHDIVQELTWADNDALFKHQQQLPKPNNEHAI